MTYPGTKERTMSAIESSLISRVTELERERDELVEALKPMLVWTQHWHTTPEEIAGNCEKCADVRTAVALLAKHGVTFAADHVRS